jgi:cysteine desulfuration protein SufE
MDLRQHPDKPGKTFVRMDTYEEFVWLSGSFMGVADYLMRRLDGGGDRFVAPFPRETEMRTSKLAQKAQQLIDEFAMLDDWNDRFQYIIELGDQLDALADEYRVEENMVQGCQSQVWLVAQMKSGDPPTMELIADSDSQLVRGLIAILVMLLSGKTPQQILSTNVEDVFKRLELQRHLSRSRSNGLHSMIKRIRELAATAA